MIIHIVKAGETINSIARQYDVDPVRLAFDNDLDADDRLPIGQSLSVIIPTLKHTVKSGETLFSIAKEYGVSLTMLWRQNLILNGGDSVYDGQTLYIETEREPIGKFIIGGYAYPNIDTSLLNRTLPLLSAIIPFTYGFRPDAGLVMPNDLMMLERCKYYGVSPVMHLSTLTDSGTFSTQLATELLSDVQMQNALIENVLKNAEQKGYVALDVDFEFLGRQNAEPYVNFIENCVSTLNPRGLGVLTALAPKTSISQPGLLYEGHDYAELGSRANALLLMTYEWGYTYGPPMAVSPYGNVKRVIEFAMTQIPKEKLLLGISNYGYDFTLPYVKGESKATSLSTKQAFSLAAQTGAEIQYDQTAQAPYFEYSRDGKNHIVWFEDVRSIQKRLELLGEYSLKGALYWNFNRQNNQNLTVISQNIDVLPFSLL